MISQKKGAMEMSISTIVIIVLAMTMLVLGIVLVKNIMTGATDSVETVNSQVQSQIQNLFNSEGTSLVINLGSEQTAKIKQGTAGFGIAIGFNPNDASTLATCKYKINATSGSNYCNSLSNWKDEVIAKSFITPYNMETSFEQMSGGAVFTTIKINVPEVVPPCMQRFVVEVKCDDSLQNTRGFFDVQVIKKGISFG